MVTQYRPSTKGPERHVQKIKHRLDELVEHLRDDLTEFDEPKAEALFETAAEVLTGLRTAFEHYERQAEPAMKESDGEDAARARSPRQENL